MTEFMQEVRRIAYRNQGREDKLTIIGYELEQYVNKHYVRIPFDSEKKTLDYIADIVVGVCGVSRDRVFSTEQKKVLAEARYLIYDALHNRKWTDDMIGLQFQGRSGTKDRCTVNHGRTNVRRWIHSDRFFAEKHKVVNEMITKHEALLKKDIS